MASQDINYENNIDLSLNMIKNVKVDVVSTLPTTVTEGRIVSKAGVLYIGKTTDMSTPAYVPLATGGDADALADRVSALETTVGDSSSGLVKDVADNTTAIGTKVTANDAITAGTKCKITYDAKGLVTAGADLSASDIPTLAQSKITNLTTDLGNKFAKADIDTSFANTSSDAKVLSEKAVYTALGNVTAITWDTAPTADHGAGYVVTSAGLKSAIDSAVTGAYKVKGSKTVAQINALTSKVQGDVYNVSDSGTITGGPTVIAGDNIVWDGTAWDKLAGTMDLSGYVPKTTKVNGHALSSDVTVTKGDVGLGNVDNTSDADKPISTATQTALDGKVAKNDAITAGTATKITYDAKGLVTGGTTLAESDIPTLSISKTSGLQTALDNKLDDSQLKTAWSTTTSDSNIPSEKLVKGSLDNKVDKVTGKGLSTNDFTDALKTKLDGIATGAQVNVIETVKVNGTALTVTSKAVDISMPVLKTASVTTTADTDTTVSGVGTGKTPRCVQVYNASGEVVMCYIKVASGSLTINTSQARTLTVAWME